VGEAGRGRGRSRAAVEAGTYLLSQCVVCLQRNGGVWRCKTRVVAVVEDGWTRSCAVVRVPKRLASGALAAARSGSGDGL
jgi:hypothetical protein